MMRVQYYEVGTLGLFVLLIIFPGRLFNERLSDTVSNMKVQHNSRVRCYSRVTN